MIINAIAVAYGLERLNREVSRWMKGPSEADDSPQFPFIAIRGYDSIVWNRLYSRDRLELENYQLDQVICNSFCAHLASCPLVCELILISY